MSKIKINKDDKTRVLLTELLPYETPMLFSNEGFYSIVSNNQFQPFLKKLGRKEYDFKKNQGKYGIPYNYEIRKAKIGATRAISVIHPVNQLAFIDFYKKYDSVLLHLCSKSPFSLRKATKIAKFCYSPDLVFNEDISKKNEVEIEPDILDSETRLLKSYFVYKPNDLIYKFYDRHDYQRLEQKYSYLLEFDISKCFYNIYTHSITWAVKSKESAKRNHRNVSFENAFDKIMQLANYNETNGIVVGSEVSRIFAEIILQQIDLNVITALENKGVKFRVDYEIRRYVDDFFVFSNDETILDLILSTYKKELEEYKLYINESKTEKRITPFITNIAVGKRELKHLVNNLFNSLILLEKKPLGDGEFESKKYLKNDISNPYKLSGSFIKDFQCIVQRNNLTYTVLCNDVVRDSKKYLIQIFKDDKIVKENNVIEKILLLILDISFYAYSLNVNSSSTFKIAQSIVLICKFLDDKNEDLKHNIYSKIYKEANFVMNIYKRKSNQVETNVETLNLIIALKKLGSGYLLTEKRIKDLLNLKCDSDFNNLNYFQIITILYYIDDNSLFDSLRIQMEKQVVNMYKSDNEPFSKSELTLLFFDYINCPYVSLNSKKKVIRESKYAKSGNEQIEIDEITKHTSWFMDWDKDIDLEGVLKKKEWGSSY